MRGLAMAAGVAVGGLVPAAIVAGMIRTADGAHLLSNQLKTVTKDSADLKNTQDSLFDVAQRTRSAFDATVTIYARTARATEHLGLSQQKLLRITETVQKSFAIGGATAQEAQGAAIQLSQGIASNRFSGDEFRSVAENAPVLLRGMAESLGVNIGKLREMAHAGELTADVVTKAIIGASKRIDEEFAKTTSTIEQAWVKVGNAVTKYTMDSEGASVASNALVTVLNALAANIDTVADSLLLIGGAAVAAFTGRGLGAAKQWVGVLAATTVQSRLSAAEALKAAQVEAAANATRLASAKAYYAMVTQGVASERTRVVASRQLHAANVANLASQKALTAATQQHATALKAASVSGMAMAATGRAASAAWSFIGGPFGAALLVVSAVMYKLSADAAEAEARATRYADAIEHAKQNSDGSAGSIRRLSEEFHRLAEKAGAAETIAARMQALKDQKITLAQLAETYAQAGRGLINLSTAMSDGYKKAGDLVIQFSNGKITAEEFKDALDLIAAANPDFSPWILEMMKLGDQADAERGRIDSLNDSLLALQKSAFAALEAAAGFTDGGVGKKSDRPRIPTKEEFNSRFGQPYAKSWKELFPEWYKPEKKPKKQGAPRKTADDRFDNSLQALQDRTQTLIEERNALNLTYAEQLRREEGLKLEQEALKQAREEARKKGEADWQNAQLSEGQVQRINERVDAYVREAMALKQAKESQEAWNTAAGEFGGVMKGLIDGTMEWQDALLQLIPVVLKLMNSLNVAQGGKGLFGGGMLQSLVGGLLGFSFHGGGTIGRGGNVVQFPSGAPYVGKFHTGGNFGGQQSKHDEVLALVQKHENIFTDTQTDQIIGALSSSASRMKERDFSAEITVKGVFVDDRGVVKGIATQQSAAAAGGLSKKVPAMVDQRVNTRQTRGTRA